MKILQIVYSLSPGGAERFVVDLSNELTEQNNEVYLCVLRSDKIGNHGFFKSQISGKVHYSNLEIPPGFKIGNIFKLNKVIKNIKPDMVHCHQGLVSYVFPIALIKRKIIYFHTIHTISSKDVTYKPEVCIKRFFYKKEFVKPITISGEVSKSYKDFYKLINDTLIYNGRRKQELSINADVVKEQISKLKDSKEKTVFIHVARYNELKNQQILINVFNKLEEQTIPTILLIIGSGYDSIEGKKLQAAAGKNIYFLGEKENVSDYYFCADAFCLSSSYEGMPISLIEAFAYGCVPVCTPVGGINDAVKHGITGYLSKSVSEKDYFDAVMEYLNNRGKISRKTLIEYYEMNFSIEKCAKEHIKLYNSKKHEKYNQKSF